MNTDVFNGKTGKEALFGTVLEGAVGEYQYSASNPTVLGTCTINQSKGLGKVTLLVADHAEIVTRVEGPITLGAIAGAIKQVVIAGFDKQVDEAILYAFRDNMFSQLVQKLPLPGEATGHLWADLHER
jgi:hypothetical protein